MVTAIITYLIMAMFFLLLMNLLFSAEIKRAMVMFQRGEKVELYSEAFSRPINTRNDLILRIVTIQIGIIISSVFWFVLFGYAFLVLGKECYYSRKRKAL